MASPGLTELSEALMVQYDVPFRGQVGWSKGALAGMITKVKSGGKGPSIQVRNGNSAAVSASFAKAQALASATDGYTDIVEFLPQFKKKFGVCRIDGMLLSSAESPKGSAFGAMVGQVQGVMDGVMNQFSTDIYRNGYGSIGRVAASGVQTLASTRLKLANPEDVVHFSKGMKLTLSATDHADLLRSSGAEVRVTGIEDAKLGYITLSANLATTLSDATYGDFIFISGNRQDSATPAMLNIPGMDAWFPVAVPSSGADFTGVDRSNEALLRGTVIDATTGTNVTSSLEDLCLDAITESQRFGGRPGKMKYFTNPTNFKKQLKLGQAKYRPDTTMGPYGIGFSGVKIATDAGEIDIVPDRYCPVQRSYLLDMSTIKVYCNGAAEIPRFLNHDNAGNILRVTDEDAVEARVGYYATVGCNEPIVNCIVQHSTT